MNTTPRIMLVDDSREDAELFRAILDLDPAGIAFSHCETGDAALDYLLGPAPRPPSLIFLDLNLPGTDGREVLQRLKQSEEIRTVPVVVTSTSNNPTDINYCYATGASGYFTKPVDLEEFSSAFQTILTYWLRVLKLPEL